MEPEGGGPQAKWLKHLQIFDFWRARLHKDGLQTLGGIAETGTSEAARVAACIRLLDRGWGRPPQTHTGEDGERDIQITIRHITEGRNNKRVRVDACANTNHAVGPVDRSGCGCRTLKK